MATQQVDEKTSLIIALIRMARVDGRVNHYEQMNISLLTNTLGVDHAEVTLLARDIDNVPVVVPVTREDKVKYFWRILIMMKMDLQAHEAELKLAQELGEALELAANEVRGLIDYMAKNVAKFISLEKFESQLIDIQRDPKYAPVKTFWQKLFPWMK